MKKRPFPRLSRGGKILRNLLLVLMLAVYVAGWFWTRERPKSGEEENPDEEEK